MIEQIFAAIEANDRLKLGTTIRVRVPENYTVVDGPALALSEPIPEVAPVAKHSWLVRSGLTQIPTYWIEDYFVQVDALLAMPVFEHSVAARQAIASGRIRKVSYEQAQELNNKFRSEGDWAAKFLDERLAERMRVISRQYAEYKPEPVVLSADINVKTESINMDRLFAVSLPKF